MDFVTLSQNSVTPNGVVSRPLQVRLTDVSRHIWRCGKWCVYLIGSDPSGPIKIGYANRLRERLGDLQVGNWLTLKVWGAAVADDRASAEILEKHLHGAFTLHQLSGEWFDVNAGQVDAEMRRYVFRTGLKARSILRFVMEQQEAGIFDRNHDARGYRQSRPSIIRAGSHA